MACRLSISVVQRSISHAWTLPCLQPLGLSQPAELPVDVQLALIRLGAGCFNAGAAALGTPWDVANTGAPVDTDKGPSRDAAPQRPLASGRGNGRAKLPRMSASVICSSGLGAAAAKAAYVGWFVGVGRLLLCPSVTTQRLQACSGFEAASGALLGGHALLRAFPSTLVPSEGGLHDVLNTVPARVEAALRPRG